MGKGRGEARNQISSDTLGIRPKQGSPLTTQTFRVPGAAVHVEVVKNKRNFLSSSDKESCWQEYSLRGPDSRKQWKLTISVQTKRGISWIYLVRHLRPASFLNENLWCQLQQGPQLNISLYTVPVRHCTRIQEHEGK